MKTSLPALLFPAAFAVLAGCAHTPATPLATARLDARSGSTASGTIAFTPHGHAFDVKVDLTGLAPNSTHGIHVHEKGDCSAADASSAGGHFNPTSMPHGSMHSSQHHAGDFDNVTADANGEVHTMFRADFFTLGSAAANDIAEHAIVLHADPDDLKTQPSGNSGKRIACGVVTLTPVER